MGKDFSKNNTGSAERRPVLFYSFDGSVLVVAVLALMPLI